MKTLAVFLFFHSLAFAQAGTPVKTCKLTQTVNYKRFEFRDFANLPIKASVLEVDLTDPKTYIRPISPGGCKLVSRMGKETGAIATVNGTYFDGKCKSVTMVKVDGVIKALNGRSRSVLGIDGANALQIATVSGGQDWAQAVHAMGGIPRIVTNGRVDVQEEGYSESFATGRHPRTAVGLIDDRHAIIVTVDGRSTTSKGMSLEKLAEFMIGLGAKQAVNLDGGGSTAMWIDSRFRDPAGIVNSPSDGSENAVATGLGVYSPANYTASCH